MNCRQAEHHIYAERDGALDEVRRAALAAHVADCAGCRQIREILTVAVDKWRADGADIRVPDADIEWQKVRRQIRGGTAAERRSVLNWIAVPLAAAAALAVGLYMVPTGHHPGTAIETGPIATREAAVSNGATQDSSTVIFVDDKSGWTFVVGPGTTG
jgi:hypothetical protein